MRGPTPRFYFAPNATWTTLDAAISWEEITDYVMSERGAGGQRGRSSELDDMRAGTFNCTLDNTDRRFDPMHTGSPYYATYLNATGASGSYASTPDVAALDIVGDLDIRVKVSADDWTPSANQALIAKWEQGTGNQRAWFLRIDATTGTLSLNWSADGTAVLTKTSTASPTVTDGGTLWVRATLDVNNGAAGSDVRFYTSTDTTNDHALVSWTQLGSTVTTAGTTSIFNSSAAASVGGRIDAATNLAGKVYAAAILNGIGGTVVADPVFAIGVGVGATSVTDSTGKVWTVNSPATIAGTSSYLKPGVPFKVTGTANSTEYPVFRGFINGWPQDYDVSNRLGFVNLSVTDGMAKLATAGTPSSVYALEVAADSPAAWWRLSETSGDLMADSSGNGHHGAWQRQATSASGRHPNLYETVPAINFDDSGRAGTLSGGVEGILTGRPFSMDFVFQEPIVLNQDDAIVTTLFRLEDAAGEYSIRVQLSVHNGLSALWQLGIYFNDETSLQTWVRTASSETLTVDGLVYHVGYRIGAAGSAQLYLNGVATGIVSDLNLSFANVVDNYVVVGVDDLDAALSYTPARTYRGPMADIALYNADIGASRLAVHSAALFSPWDGDTTGARIDRILALEPAWPSDLIDTATGYTTLGPATLSKNKLQLIKNYEKAEQGRFFISRDGKATFRDRYYNVTVAAGSTSQATFSDDGVGIPYSSLGYDDARIYNRIRASRPGGADIEVFDQTSIDDYGEEVDTSLSGIEAATDDVVRSAAEWRLVRYKDARQRTRPIEVKLHGRTAAQQATILGLDLGHRVTIERTPQGVGSAISQEVVVESITHRISGGSWVVGIATSPTDLLDVFVLDDSLLDSDAVLGY